jgi:glycosidase
MRLALLLAAAISACAAPKITKLDPPNWWPGHSINPVRVLIRGSNLAGARVETVAHDLRVFNVKSNSAGTYIFADFSIDRTAKPGARELRIITSEGSTTATFDITAPLARSGRFQGFSSDDVIYLLLPDRFANGDPANDDPPISRGLYDPAKPRFYHGGDLRGVIDRLPYLKDLGVTAIWLTPIYDNANQFDPQKTYDGQPFTDYHGYGAVDFYAVDEHLGTVANFRELVDTAHASGIKIIVDMVANHTGPDHPWVRDPPTRTWYHGTPSQHLVNKGGEHWMLADPHSAPALRKPVLDGWFLDILPDLNQDDLECARYIIQNTLWWIGISGVDGIRQDTMPYVPRTFWREWTRAIKREYPNFRVLGEVFDRDPAVVSLFQGGRAGFDGVDTGVDTVFDFASYFQVRNAFAMGQPLRELPAVLAHDRLYAHPEALVTFLGLHDVRRFMSEPGATIETLKLAFTYLMTTRGTPVIYYGDEIAMSGGNDPDNRRDFPLSAFSNQGRHPPQSAVYNHVRALARLRSQSEPLRRGGLTNICADDQTWIYARRQAGQTILVALDNGDLEQAITCSVEMSDAQPTDLLGGRPARIKDGIVELSLAPRSAAVYALRE